MSVARVSPVGAFVLVALVGVALRADEPAETRRSVVDLSLTVAADLPCVWPVGMTPLAVVPTATFGRTGRHRDMLVIDEHTGTQWDAPAHFVP
ncbi:MAG: cyclase family protein, partial [Planctomycetia bacterium]